jgi:hypothetical protein
VGGWQWAVAMISCGLPQFARSKRRRIFGFLNEERNSLRPHGEGFTFHSREKIRELNL